MSPAACPRLFEAEAMRDDRLGAAERASFERHMTVCVACSREVQALEMLAEPLRESAVDADELHARRERLRLLAAYDRTLVAPERRQGVWRRWLAVPAVAAMVIAGLVFWRMQPVAPRVHASNAVVHADSSAVWSRRTDGDREQVVLERGVLFIRVAHPTSAKTQFFVVLPDGELEDIGTTFTVSAQAGHTTRVSVEEGSVVLRIRGRSPVAIGAGDTWIPEVRQSAQACPPAAAPAAAVPTAREPSSSVVRAARGGETSAREKRAFPVRAASSRRAIARTATEQPDPASDFRSAVAVLERGNAAEAATAFARFSATYPRDPRVEDATYLRVIALQKRGGDQTEMKRAAQHYLSRFPAGLRRLEVERLSAQPPEPVAR
jgi:hypothetical protein